MDTCNEMMQRDARQCKEWDSSRLIHINLDLTCVAILTLGTEFRGIGQGGMMYAIVIDG